VNARSTLEPGDILFTGSPAGVAQGDGRFLKSGDIIETTIEKIGSLRNRVLKAAQR
jgi:2-keto-4-pentenoate hydratase/2-oxohepta-3-ene-1,7-dioic acid hydratase in catechol pathway